MKPWQQILWKSAEEWCQVRISAAMAPACWALVQEMDGAAEKDIGELLMMRI